MRSDLQRLPASSAVSTGVLPLPSFWRGAFTESAVLCSSTPPVTRWSKSMRTAAMCCFDVTVNSSLGGLEVVAHVERSDVLYALLAAVLEVREERAQRPAVSPAGVVVVDRGPQEVLDAVARLAARACNEAGGWP